MVILNRSRRIGKTKVFVRNAVHQMLERQREERITKLLVKVQALARGRYTCIRVCARSACLWS